MKKVGIFGGSFNPIHVGHVALAKALREHCHLDEVWLMVSPQNPLKQQADLLDDRQRYEMAQLALRDVEGLRASDYEFQLPKPSYTWNTLQALQEAYTDDQFTILIGGDNWAAFDKWYRYEDILQRYPIVVYPREGSEVTGFEFQVPKIKIVKTPLINISSTQIRQRIQAGKSVRGLVPTGVAMVLEQEHLYR